MKIILGSQSPRRRELMAGLNIPFTTVTIHADESYPPELQRGDIPIYISRAKARAYAGQLQQDDLLITADTIVWLDGKMLGKPHTEQEAKQMLRQLSGKTHQVYTGVTFLRAQRTTRVRTLENVEKVKKIEKEKMAEREEMESFVDRTDVTFKQLTDEEIDFYVSHYHPLDKAGAYGIQEFIGYIGVTHLKGSYFNVMGFPIAQVYKYLKKYNF